MGILGSAWDNLVGGIKDTVDTANDFQWKPPTASTNADYNFYMTLTLKQWQAAHGQLLDVLQKKLSSGVVSQAQYYMILQRRDKLYAAAGVKLPGGTVQTPKPPTISDGLNNAGKDLAAGVGGVIGSIGDTGVGAVGGAVDQIAGIKSSYLVLAAFALVIIKVIR